MHIVRRVGVEAEEALYDGEGGRRYLWREEEDEGESIKKTLRCFITTSF